MTEKDESAMYETSDEASKLPKELLASLTKELGLVTLEAQGRDELDFHSIPVWVLKSAIEKAYKEGYKKGYDFYRDLASNC